RRLKEHGWVALSQALADENHLRVGEAFTLPSPRPETFRVAALTTNLGWPPGAIVLNSQDYATAWASTDPSAYEIHTTPGVAPGTVRREAQAALGPNTGLTVQTASERERLHYKLAAQGLSRLTQIRVLVLIAAIIAMLAALGSLISEHRKLMEDLRGQGIPKGVIWRWLLWETAILLTVGCLTGAVFGIYGQLLLSHALQTVTGFPTSLNIEPVTALTTFIFLTATALILIALPGYLIVRVPTAKTRTAS
ncbi:MAG: FtsX-like permease family protein, partial [Solirubrobacteraceae bacterium]